MWCATCGNAERRLKNVLRTLSAVFRKRHITGLTQYADPAGYAWNVSDESGTAAHYRTDKRGEGLWIIDERDGSESQLCGTAQFWLTQTTDSGRREYIRRWFTRH